MGSDLLIQKRCVFHEGGQSRLLILLVFRALYIEIDPGIWNDVCQLLAGFIVGSN
jgi:hypothetical protein